MKIEVFETIKNENIDIIRFFVDGLSLELANAFRRIILSEVPCMAIDEIIFLENGSPLFDEFIAHRLGLMPLTTDLKHYNIREECACGGVGCSLCQVELTCSIKADLDGTIVTSKDLISTDPKIVPVKDDIIIAKLQKNSSLEFEAYARLGIGKEHAKWQPVSTVGFGYYPEIKIKNSSCKKCEDPCIASRRCPERLIDFSTGKAVLIKDFQHECTICASCSKYCPQEAIEVSSTPNKFVFSVEGTGALPIKEILQRALDELVEKVEEFEGNIKDKELFPMK
ncbi:MAG: DNA-directed RNA polymerase subunit D [archaeon]|nr:DNA-directed RNA polymerase subunit D [archaeon]